MDIKIKILLSVIAVLFVCLLCSIYFGFTRKSTIPTVSQDDALTNAWQTYTNEEFGFEFKYPGKYIYAPDRFAGSQDLYFYYQSKADSFMVSYIKYSESLSDFNTNYLAKKITGITYYDLGNPLYLASPSDQIYFDKGAIYQKNGYIFVIYCQALDQKTISQIISTIKFIGSPIISSNSYTDTVVGFSFTYNPIFVKQSKSESQPGLFFLTSDARYESSEMCETLVDGAVFSIFTDPGKCPIFDNKTDSDPGIKSRKNISVDGRDAIQTSFSWDCASGHGVQIQEKNNCIYISINSVKTYQNLWSSYLDLILSTFKFTN